MNKFSAIASDQPSTREDPWPVSLMAEKLRGYIDRLGMVWIEGELTQWQNRQGNIYGKLKDLQEDATVSITVWRSVSQGLSEDFKQGDRVIALVKTNYWVKGGTLTMQVHDLRHVGLGDLLERLERLKRQLASEGLFDSERKLPLPFLPSKIGLITGRNSDAEKDVLQNSRLRWPDVQFEIIYTAVQGDRAAQEVREALLKLDADPEVDIIIIARGGGDFQHLLPFSDELLVRAAAAASTPVVSAIGHEADRPLLDEVADLRASTPTDAAKRVVPDVGEQFEMIAEARARMASRLSHLIAHEVERLTSLRQRPVLAAPERIVDERAEELLRFVQRGAELSDRHIIEAKRQTAELGSRLKALSPQATLNRGYAIVQASGEVVSSPQDAPKNTPLTVTVAGGRIGATSLGEIPAEDRPKNFRGTPERNQEAVD